MEDNNFKPICPGCGYVFGNGEAFCPECGTKAPAFDAAPVAQTVQEAAPVEAAISYAQPAVETVREAAPVEATISYAQPSAEAVQVAAPVSFAQPAPYAPIPQGPKQCSTCGAIIPEGSQFCITCGRPTPAAPAPGVYPAAAAAPEKKKKKWLLWVLIGVGAMIAAAVAAVLLFLGYQPKAVKLAQKTMTLEVGQSYSMDYEVTPSKAKDKSVKWETSNKSVATVSDGEINAVAPGSCTITATTSNGKKATCRITVELSEYDKAVIGKWVCNDIYDMEEEFNYDPREYGTYIYLTVNEDHTLVLDYGDGDTYTENWEYTETNDYDNYMYDTDDEYFLYATSYDEIWMYIGDYCIAFEKD